MTAPIHAVSWLKTQPPNITGAEFALNRSLLAAVYGEFNVRNEVDAHNTTVGAHYNNTHFLTGDGGYLQILLNGFGGLMLAQQDGMQLNPPVLPQGADELAVLGMKYHGFTVDYVFDSTTMRWAVTHSTSPAELCLFKPPMGRGAAIRIGSESNPTELDLKEFFAGDPDGGMFGRVGLCQVSD